MCCFLCQHVHICVSAGWVGGLGGGVVQVKWVKTTLTFRDRYCRFHLYNLYVSTPLLDSGNSPPFHRGLLVIPHRIRDKKERKGEGESSRGGNAVLLFVASTPCFNITEIIEVLKLLPVPLNVFSLSVSVNIKQDVSYRCTLPLHGSLLSLIHEFCFLSTVNST